MYISQLQSLVFRTVRGGLRGHSQPNPGALATGYARVGSHRSPSRAPGGHVSRTSTTRAPMASDHQRKRSGVNARRTAVRPPWSRPPSSQGR